MLFGLFLQKQLRAPRRKHPDYKDMGWGKHGTTMPKIAFSDNWIFYRAGHADQKAEVSLPHDAMLREGRSNLNPGKKNSAWFSGADYVYEKNFTLPDELSDKKVIFEFEGVYHNAEVYINGEKAASRPYGYTNFYVDAGPYIYRNKENHIRVIAKNADQPNSRWYSGAGIYRPVWMHVLPEKHHILLNGVKIKTLEIAVPEIEAVVLTSAAGNCAIEVLDGENILYSNKFITDGKLAVEIELPTAALWSPGSPKMYTLRVLFGDDSAEIPFGIRKIECDAKKGFRINGERVILRGACIHHDNGLLGAVCHPFAEARKIEILKKNGYNAIRSAHNPCSKALLDACDRMGMLVLDEYVDMWYIHKTKYDYAKYMQDWWKQDLADMADKDYNHPSVVLYSIGNEVSETAQERGIGLTGEMTEYLHSIDSSRPVTCGVNIFFNYLSSLGFGVHSDKKAAKVSKSPKKDKAVGSEFFNNLAGMLGDKFMKFGASLRGSDRKTRDAFAKLDVAGYNYGVWRYKKDVKKYPNRVILGSETFCSDVYRFWDFAKNNPSLIGDFVWAGMDYIGEVGIGSWVYRDHAPDFKGGAGWITAGSGRLDITGKPTCETTYTKVAFEQELIGIGVVPVNNYGKPHSPSAWKMSNAVESWSWDGCEGKKTLVEVYARGFKVALFINGRKIGEKKLKKDCICRFKTKYAKGNITAVSYSQDGAEIARCSLESAGAKTMLTLNPEAAEVPADGLCYVRIRYTDAEGVTKPLIRGRVKVSAEGGTLIGLGHACPYNPDGYLGDSTDTYFGEALAIIQPNCAGKVTVTAESPHGNAAAEIRVKS